MAAQLPSVPDKRPTLLKTLCRRLRVASSRLLRRWRKREVERERNRGDGRLDLGLAMGRCVSRVYVGAEGAHDQRNQREFREIGRGVAPVAGEVGLAVDLWGRSGRCRRHTRKLRERGQSGVVTHLLSPVGPDSLSVQVLTLSGQPDSKLNRRWQTACCAARF